MGHYNKEAGTHIAHLNREI